LILVALFSAAAAPALAQSAPGARPAAAAQQSISRAVYMQRVDAAFVSLDTNKDGFTDKAEMEASQTRALAQRKTQMLRQREAAFRRLDANKDGSLSLAEFNSAAAAAPLPKPNIAPTLARFDTNKDGKVSLTENRAPALAAFDRADTNKDGTLSAAERSRVKR
jgi:Ca2+-binding EF-hand superfamily protein